MRVFRQPRLVLLAMILASSGCGDDTVGGGDDSGWDQPGGGGTHPAGDVATSTLALPAGTTNACEAPWTVRMLAYHPDPVVPRRMYVASCTPPGGKPKLFTSVSLKPEADTSKTPAVSGAIFEAQLDPGTGALVPTGVARALPECVEMHGIAAKSDCSLIGVLCRRASRASETQPFTKDMVAALPDTGEGGKRWWITQPGTPAQGEQRNDEEWLYEWTDGNVTTTPTTYVAHKAIGGWVYGSQYLVYGETDDTFGLSLKATVYGGGTWHEGDALMIVDRKDHSLNLGRGWTWGCAAGHTLFNHPTFNPATSKYAVQCGTDLGVQAMDNGGYGGLWVHAEGGASQGFLSLPIHNSISIGGGASSLVPLPDGGYLAVFAGPSGSIGKNQDFQKVGPVSEIGLARVDAAGALVGNIVRLAAKPGVFLSYPQLAPLGDGTFLLGYGEMVALAEQTDWGTLRVPASYHVLEVDENGAALTEDKVLEGLGWGEQDQMVPLGPGRVGWVYTPNPVRTSAGSPACAAKQLVLGVYTKK